MHNSFRSLGASAVQTVVTHKDSMCLIFWMSWLSLLVCFFSFSTSSLDDLCLLWSRLSSSRRDRDRFLSDMVAIKKLFFFFFCYPGIRNLNHPVASQSNVSFSQRNRHASRLPSSKTSLWSSGTSCEAAWVRESTATLAGEVRHYTMFNITLNTDQLFCASIFVRTYFSHTLELILLKIWCLRCIYITVYKKYFSHVVSLIEMFYFRCKMNTNVRYIRI